MEVGALCLEQVSDYPHDGEDDEAGDQRREGARYRGRYAVRQADHPVAANDEGKHLGRDETNDHAGDDVGATQPVGTDRIGLADAEGGDRHEGGDREQTGREGINLALFCHGMADEEGRHQGHDPQGTVIDAAANALEAVQGGYGGGIESHPHGVEEGSLPKTQEDVVDQDEHGPGQGQGHQFDEAILDGVDMRLLTQLDGNGQYGLFQRCDHGAHGVLLTERGSS